MSFKATFEVDGKSYRVVKLDYTLSQFVDDTGRPSSTTRAGTINITVESTDDTTLFEWMCDSYMRKDGKITFNKRDEDAKMKVLEFNEAYMVNYKEFFDSFGPGSMQETFSLSAHIVKMGNGEIESEWVM
jgi:ADP-ribosylglycohydrolase